MYGLMKTALMHTQRAMCAHGKGAHGKSSDGRVVAFELDKDQLGFRNQKPCLHNLPWSLQNVEPS